MRNLSWGSGIQGLSIIVSIFVACTRAVDSPFSHHQNDRLAVSFPPRGGSSAVLGSLYYRKINNSRAKASGSQGRGVSQEIQGMSTRVREPSNRIVETEWSHIKSHPTFFSLFQYALAIMSGTRYPFAVINYLSSIGGGQIKT